MRYPRSEEANLVSSVTSPNMRKVTFVGESSTGFLGRGGDWGILDETLCRLADRLGSKRVLEVDFRLVDTRVMEGAKRTVELEIMDSLARFRDKGRVKVIRVCSDGSERVVYTSGRVLV